MSEHRWINLAPARGVCLLAVLLPFCQSATALERDDPFGFALRNQNPFLQIYGLPLFQSAALVAPGESGYLLAFDLANHADAGSNPNETVTLDGESYFVTFSYRRGINNWLELGVDVPLVSHADGFMDDFIEGWHDLFGMSNVKRQGPPNILNFHYSAAGSAGFDLQSGQSGLGDIQLTAAMPVRTSFGGENFRMSVRTSLKLPTGDPDKLLGSGAVDLSLAVYAADTYQLWQRPLTINGVAGLLALGDGDVLPELQESIVPFVGAAAAWQLSSNLDFILQAYLQGSYFDSELDEIGSNSVQLTIGGEYRFSDRRTTLVFGLVEDLYANTTPDFGLHFSIRVNGR